MRRFLPLLVPLTVVTLAACGPKPQADDLTTRVLFTANGSYDAQADERGRVGGLGARQRRVTWQSKPPLDAEKVVVQYDGDQRSRSWLLTVDQPRFDPLSLAPGTAALQTSQGEGHLISSGKLAGALLLSGPGQSFRLMSGGYAVQYAPELAHIFEGH